MAISQIVQNSLSDTISLGPKITSVQVANSTYVVKDDTAINIGGGYIVITGSGFQSNCSVIVDSNIACSVAFVSATQVRAELPAKPAGTYNLYLLNGDGGTAIRVNALQYSNTPTWVTASPLANQFEDSNVSIQLSATGANTYVLQTGSSLPTGLTLSANGLISGFVNTNVAIDTTYNFTVEAIDTELQETPKAFAVTITIGDPFFNRTVLLLDGDGTSGANNNVFRDSSNNNLAITRNGNTTQGTFSPYSPAGWSNYFDGTGDYIQVADNAALELASESNWTVEFWGYFVSTPSDFDVIIGKGTASGNYEYFFEAFSDRTIDILYSANGTTTWTGQHQLTGDLGLNQWFHFAAVRNGATFKSYVNGVEYFSGSSFNIYAGNGVLNIGGYSGAGGQDPNMYISNLRIVKGSAVYTGNFTPSTSPLTAITNTSLLTCQDNRFRDNSTNNFTITRNGDVRVTNFSPFAPTAAYSAATQGGSAYFDQTTDWLSVAAGSHFNFSTNALTIEAWVYTGDEDSRKYIFGPGNNTADHYDGIGFEIWDNRLCMWVSSNGSGWDMLECDTSGNRGNILIRQNAWNHVAMTRSGNTWRSFVNGVLDRTFTVSGTVFYNASVPYNIGRTGYLDGSFYFDGYISQLRVTNGTALYTSNFSVPTEPLVPVENTMLLANMTNASILDYTTKNVIETVGAAKINTAVTKYGTGSIDLSTNNNDSWLITPPTDMGDFGTGDFTVEFWMYPSTISTGTTGDDLNDTIIDLDSSAGTANTWWVIHQVNSGITFGTNNSTAQNSSSNVTSTLTASAWNHVAVVRNSGTVRIYINGISTAGHYIHNTSLGSTRRVYIGKQPGSARFFKGNLDDFRITKGLARYTSNFTPPTEAHRKR